MGKKKDKKGKKAKKVKPKPVAKPKPQTRATKGRKKKWFTILASKSFRETPIGQCLVYEPGVLVGRVIEVNLMSLLNDFKKQNSSLSFKIIQIKGENALTEPYCLKMSPTALKRMVRRGRDRCDTVIKAETSTGATVLMKLMFLTRNNTSKSVLTALRKNAKIVIEAYAKERGVDALILDAVNGKIQKALRDAQKKIYPLRSCDVRYLKVIDAEKRKPLPVKEEAEEKKETKKEEKAPDKKEDAKESVKPVKKSEKPKADKKSFKE